MPESRVVLAVAAGGALGALGRQAATEVFPRDPGSFGWTVLAVNVAGCALLGMLVSYLADRRPSHRLVRPFLGVGVLGGFTTFSAFTLDAFRLADDGELPGAVAYLALTVLGCLGAAALGVRLVARR
jgi:CrcB protein